jgi:signal transduction histidine kinase
VPSSTDGPLRSALRETIHAINSPLGVILGTTQFALSGIHGKQLSDISESDFEDILESFQVIERQAHRSAELVQGMRSLVTAGRFESHRVDLAQCLKSAMQRIEGEAAAVSIELDAPDTLPRIEGNIDKLIEAFTELARNAFDAMPDGGVLRIRAEHAEELKIVFEDKGHGIEPKALEKAFSPFYSTSGEDNRGWGLPIARLILQAHGADIEIESAVGEGTKVNVVMSNK